MASYGAIAVILYLFLLSEFDAAKVSILLVSIMAGDFCVTLFLSSKADNTIGRRHTLMVGSSLKMVAGLGYCLFPSSYLVIFLCGTIGVITPTGGEIGPFLNIEQAALSEVVACEGGIERFSYLMAWYQAGGGLAAAFGAFAAGQALGWARDHPQEFSEKDSAAAKYRVIFASYSCIAFIMLTLYWSLSDEIEVKPRESPHELASIVSHDGGDSSTSRKPTRGWLEQLFGLMPEFHHLIFSLAILFALDAFAGALVLQSYLSLWFHEAWGLQDEALGSILTVVNAIGGLSGFVSSWLVRRIGAVPTMVFTHLPSNVLLALIPLMPTVNTALGMLFARYCISQMDVPARQAYVNMVVPSHQRSAANGATNSARTVGVCLAPLLLRLFLQSRSWMSVPFYVAGALKIVYDLTLYWRFHYSQQDTPADAGTVTATPVSEPSATTYGTLKA
jgi:MFS family permease